jgi:hypothetical protein
MVSCVPGGAPLAPPGAPQPPPAIRARFGGGFFAFRSANVFWVQWTNKTLLSCEQSQLSGLCVSVP